MIIFWEIFGKGAKKDFDELGIEFKDVIITPEEIQAIRARTRLSQAIFAKLLNVSLSSVRQWEQGKRKPTGSTKVLLDLLNKSPHILDYRIKAWYNFILKQNHWMQQNCIGVAKSRVLAVCWLRMLTRYEELCFTQYFWLRNQWKNLERLYSMLYPYSALHV